MSTDTGVIYVITNNVQRMDTAMNPGEICPTCESSAIIGIQVQGVYDGILYWVCQTCVHAFPRWTGNSRGSLSSAYADGFNRSH